jgi:hypothetical protein
MGQVSELDYTRMKRLRVYATCESREYLLVADFYFIALPLKI